VSPTTPDIGKLLAPQLGSLPDGALPGFLALLERGAAARYRRWASELPAHADGLRACAAREDEIADRVDTLFPLEPDLRERLEGELPAAAKIYGSLFDGLDPLDQLAVQAGAERQGAAAWRGLAAPLSDPALRDALEACARLEEESAAYLEGLAETERD
jgi:hypothetical protein